MAATNILADPNCTALTAFGGYDCTDSVANNKVTMTMSSASTGYEWTFATSNAVPIVNHIYYARADVTALSSDCTNIEINIDTDSDGTLSGEFQANPTQNTKYTLSMRGTWVATVVDPIRVMLQMDYGGASTSQLTWEKLMLVDLTASFGAGNEPDLSTCDAWDWFEGEQATAPVLEAVQDGTHIDLSWT